MSPLPLYEYDSSVSTENVCKSTGQDGKDMCKLMYKYGKMHLENEKVNYNNFGSFIVLESLDTKVKFNGVFYSPVHVYVRYIQTESSDDSNSESNEKTYLFNNGITDDKFNGQLIICHEAKETYGGELLWIVIPIEIKNGSANKVFEQNLEWMFRHIKNNLSESQPNTIPTKNANIMLQEAIPRIRVRNPYTYVNYKEQYSGIMQHIIHFNSVEIDKKGIYFKIPIIDDITETAKNNPNDVIETPILDEIQNNGYQLDVAQDVFKADDEEAVVDMENQIVDRTKRRMTCRPVEVGGGKDGDGNVVTYKIEEGSRKSVIDKGISSVQKNGVAILMGLFGFLIILSSLLAMLYVTGGATLLSKKS